MRLDRQASDEPRFPGGITPRWMLGEAMAAGGSSRRDFVDSDGKLGYFQHGFAVYDGARAPCTTDGCNAKIKRIVQSGRSSFYSPACQR